VLNEHQAQTYEPALIDSIRRIGEVNFQITVLGHDCEVGFEHRDMWITDPLRSSCSRFAADPVATYGDAFLASPFVTDPRGSLERAMAQFDRVSRESGPLMPSRSKSKGRTPGRAARSRWKRSMSGRQGSLL